MAATLATSAMSLGFLTVQQEPNGYVGGYLVTNQWGRPMEFRLSTAVQPNRVQQILYAATLQPYICGELIGKTLVDKTGVPVQLVLTNTEAVLDLRLRLEVPVLWLGPAELPAKVASGDGSGAEQSPLRVRANLYCHPQHPGDVQAAAELLDRLGSMVDLNEPFARIREAMVEARKMGVSNRS